MKKRYSLATAAAIGAIVALVPASATAQVIELGATTTPLVAPSCPNGVTPTNCTIILFQVTALETISDTTLYPTKVTQGGRIVAFTVGLSNLSSNRKARLADIKGLDHLYGGTTQAGITVLRPTGAKRLRRYTAVAESPIIHLQPYLGEVVQFPLTTTLPVRPGDVVALTVKTWAPVLSIQLPTSKFAYRQSRTASCPPAPTTPAAMLVTGAVAGFGCAYPASPRAPGTRVEYSATEVTTPPTPRNYVHARDIGR